MKYKARTNVLVMSRKRANKELEIEFENYANIFYLDELLSIDSKYLKQQPARLLSIFPLSERKVSNKLGFINMIHSIDEISLVLAERIRRTLKKINTEVVLTVGVYHSKLFAWGGKNELYAFNLPKYIFSQKIPKENIIFYNDNSVGVNESYFNVSFKKSPIIPIGVIDLNSNVFNNVSLPPRTKKIVSIGRLVDFKKYNFNTIHALSELEGECKCIEYHIYGHGPEVDKLIKEVENLGLSNRVFFHGNLEYSSFHRVVRDAWCFVGSGTALIEAGMHSIPCIVGVESHEKTSGFFRPELGVNYNEHNENIEYFHYADVIKALYHSNDKGWIEKGDSSREASKLFDISRTLDFFIKSGFSKSEISEINFPKYVVSSLIMFFLSRVNGFNNYKNRLDK
ncbi:glycosyltransferase [Photobacterium halotolerans]|uniref:glycosyltransferase n=1 Tax=Photobacterium halotolerans TaxID=265726 RepID=UPI000486BCA4|nr:glycosyltransferase [Photobacterium halotolerans]